MVDTGATKFESRLLTRDTKPINMGIINNYDLGIPKKEISEGDHQSAEYFEAEFEEDLVKKEETDAEYKGPGTFNSVSSSGKRRETLKLRL